MVVEGIVEDPLSSSNAWVLIRYIVPRHDS
jgi:hypothetical protein